MPPLASAAMLVASIFLALEGRPGLSLLVILPALLAECVGPA